MAGEVLSGILYGIELLISAFDVHRQNINCHLVVSTLRHDEIGVSFARLYELQMHRLQDAGITLHYGFSGTAALYDITLDDTNKAFVGICVDKILRSIMPRSFLSHRARMPSMMMTSRGSMWIVSGWRVQVR